MALAREGFVSSSASLWPCQVDGECRTRRLAQGNTGSALNLAPCAASSPRGCLEVW